MACFEMLRHLENAISRAVSLRLTGHYKRADWWNAPGLALTSITSGMIREAEARVERKRLPLSAINIQRELTLGFWVSIIGRGLDYETKLWRPMKPAFPGYRGKRQPLWTQLNFLRLLRNDVAHHDRIGERHLEADRASILRALGFISAEAEVWVAGVETMGALLRSRPEPCPGVDGSTRGGN